MLITNESEYRLYIDFVDWHNAQLLNQFSNDFLRLFRDKIDWNFYIFNIQSNFLWRGLKFKKEFEKYVKVL